MSRSFRFLLPFISGTFALKLSLSASTSVVPIILTTWRHEEGDPTNGSIQLIDLQRPRVLSSFPLPSEASGSFVSLFSSTFTFVTVQAVDSKNNVFAASNTISFNHTMPSFQDEEPSQTTLQTATRAKSSSAAQIFAPSQVQSTTMSLMSNISPSSIVSPQTSPKSLPTPTETGTRTGAEGAPISPVGNISKSNSRSNKTALAPILGVTITIIFLILLFNFIYCWRIKSRKNRKRKFFVNLDKSEPGGRSTSTTKTARMDKNYDMAEIGLGTGTVGTVEFGMREKSKANVNRSQRFPRPPPAITIPSSYHNDEPFIVPTYPNSVHENTIHPYSPEPLLPPPPTPLYLKRMTPDVPVDLDDQGNSLRSSRWKSSFDSRM